MSKLRIVQLDQVIETDVKRFYVPFEVYDKCPECGEEAEGVGDYLSHPLVNAPQTLYFYCYHEETEKDVEWERQIEIRMTAHNVKTERTD